MATKCMSCGGSTTKKMKAGGTSSNKPCGPGLCRDGQGSCINCASAKLAGVITTGISSLFANAIATKKRKENKEVKGVVKDLVKKAKSTKIMQKGGATLPMMGMPMYSNNPRSEQGRILKTGGSTINRAVAPGCRGGMVKDASGKCVMERKMQDGGSKTRKNIITGRTRVTTPYAVGASSKGTVPPKDYSTGTKTEVYGKKGNLIKTKYKHRGTGKYDTEGSKYPYNYIREEEKPGGEKKETYPILPSFLQPADKLKKGGATKAKKFAALAPPYNKATFADRIVGAKKKVVKKKK